MAIVERKRRVKSIKKPVDYQPIVRKRIKKPKYETQFSRAAVDKMLKNILKVVSKPQNSVHLIYKSYLRTAHVACVIVARRSRNVSLKEVQKAMDILVPREVAMAAIREFHVGPDEKAVVLTEEEAPSDAK